MTKEELEKTIDFDDAINRIINLTAKNAKLKASLLDVSEKSVKRIAELEEENAKWKMYTKRLHNICKKCLDMFEDFENCMVEEIDPQEWIEIEKMEG